MRWLNSRGCDNSPHLRITSMHVAVLHFAIANSVENGDNMLLQSLTRPVATVPRFPQLSEALDTGWLPAGAERVMEAFAKSKDIISMAVGVLIPPPGGSVASAVVEVAYWAVQAVFNTQNCCVLARKCCDVLFAVLSNREVLGKKDTLRRAMEQLQAVANDILAFVKQFASKGWCAAAGFADC